ncbi:MAG: DNA-directed RNA polymerase subunit omega [Limnochordia bacterium]|nr:DNA-directed RNA polymerase subunit omega [Limnochordia bacterium]MDD2629898.1 DNA-directed RNA polymerase subunit omega [Limnochordia bacterium]MDD4517319.1 DNA-directed RNA polymerase subunit omega [Limnochordia bacterium]
MNQPSIDRLLGRVDSRYTAVVAAAKRARQLSEGAEPLADVQTNKPVTVALYELGSGTVRYERIRKS